MTMFFFVMLWAVILFCICLISVMVFYSLVVSSFGIYVVLCYVLYEGLIISHRSYFVMG